ncbi:RICIN domain-containing protein, partial [Micromonospora chersina]|uniref:RICIN domain-containing protein n=1 Tax=Micromonospora chersina TaxID=47854 RepID=UPI003489C50F
MTINGTAPPTTGHRRGRRPGLAVAAAVTLLASVAAAAVTATEAAAATVDTSAWYVLLNRNSGKALDVYGASTADGARI